MTVTTQNEAGTEAASEPASEAEEAPRAAKHGRGFVAKAFGVTALFSAVGSVLGLLRDLLLARFYGAGSATDAFLVSWTVPETAAPLLIEDGMAFLTVPAFSAALAARGQLEEEGADAPDPVRALVAATLPPLFLGLALISGLVALGAPVLVHALAPGLADPNLAIVCTRLTAVTVLPFGLVGYLGAGLRSHHRFTLPGAVYIAYNAAILTVMLLLHGSLGVRAAAGGVALGSVLMVAVLLPSFLRHVSKLTVRRVKAPDQERAEASPERRGASVGAPVLSPMAVLPVVLFTLTRQAQVFVERFIGSSLPPGTISHLNYAEKVAQNVMIIGILVCTVTFPLIARALAEGDVGGARERVEKDLGVVGAVVLAGTVVVFACAPQLVAVLFERGAFTPADTAATAVLMRVYCVGLLAQGLVGALIRPYLAARPAVGFGGQAGARPLDRSDWLPIWAMTVGLLVTVAVAGGLTRYLGAVGLAAGNAAGISVTAVLLLMALRDRGIPVRLHTVLGGQLRLLLGAAGAAVPAWLAANIPGLDTLGALPPLLLGTVVGLLSFVALAGALRAPGVSDALGALRGRLAARRPAVVRPRATSEGSGGERGSDVGSGGDGSNGVGSNGGGSNGVGSNGGGSTGGDTDTNKTRERADGR